MNIASKIDHTLLKADCTQNDIINLCKEAIENNFYSVCVPPSYVKLASEVLSETEVKVCTVIGFPLGYQTTGNKLFEADEAIAAGATEVDMVVNISAFKSGNMPVITNEINRMTLMVQQKKALLKVIIETAYLNREEIKSLCEICAKAKVDFVKTSTGYAERGATVEDVVFMRSILPPSVSIKASGGIKTKEDAVKLLEAGAERLGTSSGVKIINDHRVGKEASQY
jgi:deoxyribose-phosphate aldolase